MVLEGEELGSNGLLSWSVQKPTWECDWDPTLAAFGRAGFGAVVTRSIDVTVQFANFDDFWVAQTPTNSAYHFKLIGLDAGPLSQWLFSALAEADIGRVDGWRLIMAGSVT